MPTDLNQLDDDALDDVPGEVDKTPESEPIDTGVDTGVSPIEPTDGGGEPGLSKPAATDQPAPAPVGFSLRDALAEQNIDLAADATDESVFQQLFQAAKSVPAMQHQMREMQAALQIYQNQIRLQQQQQVPASSAPVEETPWYKDAWNPPEMVGSYSDWIDQDTNSLISTAPDSVRQRLEYDRQWREKFNANPYQTVWDGLEGKVREVAQDVFGRGQQQQATSYEFSEFERANSEWLYVQHDGRVVFSPADGQPIMSQEGKLFENHYRNLTSSGMNDQAALRTAEKLVQGDLMAATFQSGQPAAAAAPAGGNGHPPTGSVSDSMKADHVRQAAAKSRFPQRGGSVRQAADPASPSPEGPDFRQRAMARAREAGLV